MENVNIKRRYLISYIIDFLLIVLPITPIVMFLELSTTPWVFTTIFLIWLSFVWSQDKLFKGASIGKRICGIKVISYDESEFVTLGEVLTRRFLESFCFSSRLIYRLKVDVDKISNTLICHKSFEPLPEREIKKSKTKVDRKLNALREKAMFFDIMIMSWLFVICYLLRFDYFEELVNDITGDLYSVVFSLVMFALIGYLTLKDMLFRNASLGKRRQGIEVVDMEGKMPSKPQMLLKGFIFCNIWPVELVLFFLNKRLISERLTYTKTVRRQN